jgi:hypothetical protein
MNRALLTLHGAVDRARAIKWVTNAPPGTRLEFKQARRTIPQNDRMWAMLTDIAKQKEHCGRKYTVEEWKCLFMHACGRETQFVPALNGNGFLPLGYRSSDLSKQEMSDLIEFMQCWGAENGVTFHDQAHEEVAA